MAFAAHSRAFLYTAGELVTPVVAQTAAGGAEKLRCNICDVTVDSTAEANEHSAGKDHVLRKQKLEGDLKETASRKYGHDSSVVVQWAASIHPAQD